eukprot:354548-Chlamydomonas_euryale.AAC.18
MCCQKCCETLVAQDSSWSYSKPRVFGLLVSYKLYAHDFPSSQPEHPSRHADAQAKALHNSQLARRRVRDQARYARSHVASFRDREPLKNCQWRGTIVQFSDVLGGWQLQRILRHSVNMSDRSNNARELLLQHRQITSVTAVYRPLAVAVVMVDAAAVVVMVGPHKRCQQVSARLFECEREAGKGGRGGCAVRPVTATRGRGPGRGRDAPGRTQDRIYAGCKF